MNPDQKIYCGVDVSKNYLDAFTDGKTVRFANTVKGICALMKQAGDVHYVFESTGGYERPAAWYLLAAGRIVSVVNPGRVREYAKSIGQIAKTDRIDAQVITRFAELVHPREAELPSADQRKPAVLRSFVSRYTTSFQFQTSRSFFICSLQESNMSIHDFRQITKNVRKIKSKNCILPASKLNGAVMFRRTRRAPLQ